MLCQLSYRGLLKQLDHFTKGTRCTKSCGAVPRAARARC
jgi:hypothetical protein